MIQPARNGKWFLLLSMIAVFAAGLFTPAVFAAGLFTPGHVLAAGPGNQVQVTIFGQLLDEAAEPLAGEELQFSFYLGPESGTVEESVQTEQDGTFQLKVTLKQNAYFRSGRYFTSIEGTLLLDSAVKTASYEAPGWQEMSEPGEEESWGQDGSYRQGYIPLFYHLREMAVGGEEEEPEFADLQIQLGDSTDRGMIQLARTFTITEQYLTLAAEALDLPRYTYEVAGRSLFAGDPPEYIEKADASYQYVGWQLAADQEAGDQPITGDERWYRTDPPMLEVQGPSQIHYYYIADEAVLTVRHVEWASGLPVGEAEEYVLSPSVFPTYETQSLSGLEALAPLKVEREDEVMLEAAKGSPITGYTVAIQPGTQELIYYYHQDQDGDGVPDHLIQEQVLLANSEPLPGGEDRETIIAHQDTFQSQPPELAGYLYQGYAQNGQEYQAGVPPAVEAVSSDLVYGYYYEKEQPSGGGNGGSGGKDKTPPEPEPGPAPEPPPEETVTAELPEEPLAEPPPETALEIAETVDEEPQPNAESLDQGTAPIPKTTSEPEPALSQEERQALRNITFVKRSHSQSATPGEEVSYSFTGFENRFPYPLNEFTIVDQPDPGLDFHQLRLPAFRQGEQVVYDVFYTTNQRGEQPLIQGQRADQPALAEAPALAEEEYITAVLVRMGQVPSGFGVGDEIEISFIIGEDPTEDILHNRGMLFYEDQDEAIMQSADPDDATVSLGGGGWFSNQSEPLGAGREFLDQLQKSSQRNRTIIFLVGLSSLALAAWLRKRKITS